MSLRTKLPRLPMLIALTVALALALAALAAFGLRHTTSASHGRLQVTLEIKDERDVTISGIEPDGRFGRSVAIGDV